MKRITFIVFCILLSIKSFGNDSLDTYHLFIFPKGENHLISITNSNNFDSVKIAIVMPSHEVIKLGVFSKEKLPSICKLTKLFRKSIKLKRGGLRLHRASSLLQSDRVTGKHKFYLSLYFTHGLLTIENIMKSHFRPRYFYYRHRIEKLSIKLYEEIKQVQSQK